MHSTVDVRTISLLDPGPVFLSPDEAGRAARFRFEGDRVRWTRARSALRRVLARYLAVSPDAIEFDYGVNGKPHVRGAALEFNLSHSGDFAMIAVSEAVAVGIDIEKMRPDVEIAKLLERLDERNLPDSLAELYARWTQREARTKALGQPLFTTPAGNVIAESIVAPEGYSAAVALVGAQPIVRVIRTID